MHKKHSNGFSTPSHLWFGREVKRPIFSLVPSMAGAPIGEAFRSVGG
jgi:hypothetical protein